MAVTATNLTMGPGELYRGDFGETEPTGAAAPAGDWVDVGGTTDGVTLAVNQEYTELEVDQIVDIPGRRLTKREFTIATNIAEPTLENLAFVLNEAAEVTTATGTKSWEPTNDSSATQPTYSALIFRGWAPGAAGKRRNVIGRKMLQTESVEFAYSKDGQTVYSCSFSGHYVSPSIRPFKVVDDTST